MMLWRSLRSPAPLLIDPAKDELAIWAALACADERQPGADPAELLGAALAEIYLAGWSELRTRRALIRAGILILDSTQVGPC